jgi:hypothetical protein
MRARLRGLLGGFIGAAGAGLSSLCCLMPVAIVLLGLGSGAFMATTMKYTPVFIPVGVATVAAGFYLHLRERRRCTREGCRMVGSTWNLVLLTASALILAAAGLLSLFPALSSDLIMWAMSKQSASGTQTPMGSMR